MNASNHHRLLFTAPPVRSLFSDDKLSRGRFSAPSPVLAEVADGRGCFLRQSVKAASYLAVIFRDEIHRHGLPWRKTEDGESEHERANYNSAAGGSGEGL